MHEKFQQDSSPLVLEVLVTVTEPPNFPAAATKAITEQPTLLVSTRVRSSPGANRVLLQSGSPQSLAHRPYPCSASSSPPSWALVLGPGLWSFWNPLLRGGGSVTVTGWWALDGHQGSLCLCWAHGLLFVVGAMCSTVYCLSPPILLPSSLFQFLHLCLPRSLFVWLPIYPPGVCSPVLIHCFTSCVCYVCLYCSSLPACLFFPPQGGFCSFYY